MNKIVFPLLFFILTGCASSRDLAKADCEDYGFKPGTSAYASCVMQAQKRRDDLFMGSMRTLYCSDQSVKC